MSDSPGTSWGERVKAGLPFGVAWLVLAGALLAYPMSQHPVGWGWLETVRLESVAAFQHRETQWLAAVCAGIYFVGFLYLRHLVTGRSVRRSPRSVLILIFVGWAAWVYARDYPASATRSDFLTLLAALGAGQGVAFWIAWEARRSLPRDVGVFVLGTLVVMLAGATLLHPDAGMAYQYRGAARWKGLWDNPNTFGVLMAVGLVLAVGLMLRAAAVKAEAGRVRRWGIASWWGLCALATGVGLLKSFSRGAWLGAALGLGWLGWQWLRTKTGFTTKTHTGWRLVRACAPAWLLALAAAGVLAFWGFRHTETPLVRRVFTVGNANDLSWRNRVATWPGALEVMARRPLVGWGWGKPATVFEQGHKPLTLSEGGAVTLNDYLMLGMTLGMPALLIFVGWIWLGWRGGLTKLCAPDSAGGGCMIPLHCLAGLLPCVLALALDGALFKVAVAVPLFVLLEIGSFGSENGRIPVSGV